VLTTPPPPVPKEGEGEEEGPDPMYGIGIGVKVGFIFPMLFARTKAREALSYDAQPTVMGIQTPAVPVTDTTTVSRGGDALFSLAVPIFLGDGHGVAFDIEPTLAFCTSCDSTIVGSRTRGDYTYLGVYGGITIRFQATDELYGSVGFGLRPGLAFVDGMKVSSQGEFRVPIQFTYYLHESVGLLAELAPGFGGYADIYDDATTEAAVARSWAAGVAEMKTVTGGIPYSDAPPVADTGTAVAFGFGASLDFSVGVRFP
jgi:hypothetical protein